MTTLTRIAEYSTAFWLLGVSLLTFVWCAADWYNQRHPVERYVPSRELADHMVGPLDADWADWLTDDERREFLGDAA